MKTDVLVPTKNVRLLASGIIERLTERVPGAGRIGLVEGGSGTGKSSAARMIAKTYNGAYYSVVAHETTRSLLANILQAIHGYHIDFSSVHALYDRLLDDLARLSWPVILLDEADRLPRDHHGHDLLDVVRDLHDHSESRFVLFSVGALARKLEQPKGYYEVYSSRLAAHVKFEKASLEDAELLARELVEGVSFERDLVQHFLALSRNSIRPLIGWFGEAEKRCVMNGVKRASLNDWEKLQTGSIAHNVEMRIDRRAKGAA